jgi:hypothetical protein
MRYSRDYFLGEVQMALLSIETASHIGIGFGCLVIVAVFVIAFEKDFGRSLQVMVSMKPTSRSTSTKTKSE